MAELALHAHAPPALAIVLAPRPLVDPSRSAARNGTPGRRSACSATPRRSPVEQAAGEALRELARHVVLEVDVQHSVLRQVVAATRTRGASASRRRAGPAARRRRRRGLRHLLPPGPGPAGAARSSRRGPSSARLRGRYYWPLCHWSCAAGAAAASREPDSIFLVSGLLSGLLSSLSGFGLWLWRLPGLTLGKLHTL